MPLREINPLREKHKFSIQSIGTRHTQMFVTIYRILVQKH